MAHCLLHDSVTVSTSARGIQTAVEGKQVMRALLTVETDAIRVRYDGIAPTAASGHQVQAGQALSIDSPYDIERFKMIRSGSADATVLISYEGM